MIARFADLRDPRQKELTMSGVRSTGFAVLLTVMSLLVCQFAVSRHSGQPSPLSDEYEMDESLDRSPNSGRPRYWDHEATSASTSDHSPKRLHRDASLLQVGDPSSSVPNPVDTGDADTESPPSSTPNDYDSLAVRSVIEQELSHTTREEREIWYEELKSLPAGVVRDLLQVRKQIRELPRLFGGVPEKLASADLGVAGRTPEVPAGTVSQRIRFGFPDPISAASEMDAAISQFRHNLSNALTPGFKRLRITLVDRYRPASAEPSTAPFPDLDQPNGRIQGEGCQLGPLLLDMKQGVFRKTGRQFDLAIDGEGFFVVRSGEKEFLTRCGAFTLNNQRQLCLITSSEPAILQPPVTIPDDVREVQVSGDGKVIVVATGATASTTIGELLIARVPSADRLQPVGNTLFTATTESGVAKTGAAMQSGFGTILQAVLEHSNVDIEKEREEMEELIAIMNLLPLPKSHSATAGNLPSVPAH